MNNLENYFELQDKTSNKVHSKLKIEITMSLDNNEFVALRVKTNAYTKDNGRKCNNFQETTQAASKKQSPRSISFVGTINIQKYRTTKTSKKTFIRNDHPKKPKGGQPLKKIS